MSKRILLYLILLFAASATFAQSLPNPYRTVDGWAKLPDGRKMGAVGGLLIDHDER